MGAAIPPSFEHTIPVPPGHLISLPGLEFARDPLTLVVAEPTLVLNWKEWFEWHQSDIGLAGLLLSLTALIVLWKRRPRARARAGTWCCRGCDHELSAPQITVASDGAADWSGQEAKCPECGQRDARGPLRVGRARAWWGTGIAFAAAGLIACGFAIVLPLEVGRRPGSGQETWPIAGLEAIISSWPSKAMRVERKQGVRFVRVDLATGNRRDLGTGPDLVIAHDYLSPDGRYVVVATDHESGVLLIEIASGARRVARIPALTDEHPHAHISGFSADGREVYLVRSHQSATRLVDELFSVELTTARLRSVSVVESELPKDSKAAEMLRTHFAVSGSGESLRWVHHAGVPGAGVTFRWEYQGERRERHEEIDERSVQIRLNDDGNCCVIQPFLPVRPWGFALSDGSKVSNLPRSSPQSEQGRLALMPDGKGNLLVRDLAFLGFSRGTLRAQLGRFPRFALSPGDRYAAAIGEEEIARAWPLSALGLKPLKVWKVRVWDLKPMLDQRFGGKREPAVEKK